MQSQAESKQQYQAYCNILRRPSHTLAIGHGAPNFKTGKTGATVALEVDDFDQAITELKDKKVNFIMDCLDCPGCKMALVADPEGNQIMIHQRKK